MTAHRIGEITVYGHTYPIEFGARGFEAHIGEDVALMDARDRDGVVEFTHTEVPETLRGQGIAQAMTRAALDYARSKSLLVKPYCPFVASYIERHPEYRDLVAPDFQKP